MFILRICMKKICLIRKRIVKLKRYHKFIIKKYKTGQDILLDQFLYK